MSWRKHFTYRTNNYRREDMRRRDEAWLYGWLWRPLVRAGRVVNSLEFFEGVMMVVLFLLICMLLFCLFMACMAAFNMPQHDAILHFITVEVS